MRRAALLLLLAGLALAHEGPAAGGEPDAPGDREPDDESDSAPFMIVVEHADGRRCGGSLVSLRTALTSVWCVRGAFGGSPRELWARAPGAGVRRVARVALPVGAADAPPQPGWAGAALDLAVLEMESPFGAGARVQPILMATRAEDCSAGAVCHVVRAVGPAPRLRIVDAELVPGERCAARAHGWAAVRDTALCLAGPTLCAAERGAGVVCDGKLCGVLARSAGAAAGAVAGAASDDTCGDTHVAQGVALWRSFLHCAHTLHNCGRGGECEGLCSERRLLAAPAGDGGAGNERGTGAGGAEPGQGPLSASPPAYHSLSLGSRTSLSGTTVADHIEISSAKYPTGHHMRVSTPERTRARVSPTHTSPGSTARASFEFEPNRADFKAGEYGDNVAEYGGAEDAGAAPSPHPRAPAAAPDAPSARATPPARFRAYSGPGHVRTVAAQPTPRALASAPALRALPTAFVMLLLIVL